MPVYTPVYGTITAISPMRNANNSINGCSLLFSITTPEMSPVNFVVTGQTYVEGQETLEPDDKVVMFYDSSLPVPMIYPPQYQAIMAVELEDSESASFDYFDNQLINRDRTLKLNLGSSQETEILLANGQTFLGNPAGHYLLVLYTTTTRSIPAMTTPEKIIVFCPPLS